MSNSNSIPPSLSLDVITSVIEDEAPDLDRKTLPTMAKNIQAAGAATVAAIKAQIAKHRAVNAHVFNRTSTGAGGVQPKGAPPEKPKPKVEFVGGAWAEILFTGKIPEAKYRIVPGDAPEEKAKAKLDAYYAAQKKKGEK